MPPWSSEEALLPPAVHDIAQRRAVVVAVELASPALLEQRIVLRRKRHWQLAVLDRHVGEDSLVVRVAAQLAVGLDAAVPELRRRAVAGERLERRHGGERGLRGGGHRGGRRR